jgi:hypothetical protein
VFSILVRHGKNNRRREVAIDAWARSAIEPWQADRVELTLGYTLTMLLAQRGTLARFARLEYRACARGHAVLDAACPWGRP